MPNYANTLPSALAKRNPLLIYLAGPDVFRVDAAEYATYLKQICDLHGFVGIFPLDNEMTLNEGEDESVLATRIALANEDMIRKADVVLANLAPFRGAEPDSGTVCEVVIASLQGKPVYAYFDDEKLDMVSRVRDHHGPISVGNNSYYDKDGMQIENFGDPLNLMLRRHVTASARTPEICLELLSKSISATLLAQES